MSNDHPVFTNIQTREMPRCSLCGSREQFGLAHGRQLVLHCMACGQIREEEEPMKKGALVSVAVEEGSLDELRVAEDKLRDLGADKAAEVLREVREKTEKSLSLPPAIREAFTIQPPEEVRGFAGPPLVPRGAFVRADYP